jgi:putative DNA primase/helicase
VDYPQWVCWRYVDRGPNKKPDKQPVNPSNLHNAGVTWANSWSTFEQAVKTHLAYYQRGIQGIGFVLTPEDPFVGIDLDSCVANGEIAPEAQNVISHLGSYAETSPSGTGLRVLVACTEFSRNARTAQVEVYSHRRFLTMTGHHLPGTPATISEVAAQDIQALLPDKEKQESRVAPPTKSAALWQHIFAHDHYGAQHLRRFYGDTSFDRNDLSFTVIRLLNCLARWTQGDAAKMREMMLLSPLAEEKWFSKRGKGDWLDHQIADAIAFITRKR